MERIEDGGRIWAKWATSRSVTALREWNERHAGKRLEKDRRETAKSIVGDQTKTRRIRIILLTSPWLPQHSVTGYLPLNPLLSLISHHTSLYLLEMAHLSLKLLSPLQQPP